MSEKCIYKAGFTNVRPAHNRNARVIVFTFLFNLRKVRNNFIKHITETQSLFGGNCYRTAYAEGIEVINSIFVFRMINFVYDRHDRFFAAAEHIRNILIRCCKPRFAVKKENYNLRRFNCKLCLPTHLFCNYILAFRLNAAGINKREPVIQPLRIRVNAVTCHARSILNYRYAFPRYFVKKCGFADIRQADDT